MANTVVAISCDTSAVASILKVFSALPTGHPLLREIEAALDDAGAFCASKPRVSDDGTAWLIVATPSEAIMRLAEKARVAIQ